MPPEPLAWLGGSLVRTALVRRERIEQEGGQADALTRAALRRPAGAGDPPGQLSVRNRT